MLRTLSLICISKSVLPVQSSGRVCSYPRQKCKVVEGEYPGWYQLWEFPGHYQRWGYYQAGQPYTCPGDLGTACKAGDSVECCCVQNDHPPSEFVEETICENSKEDEDEEDDDLLCFPPPFGCLSVGAIVVLIGLFLTIDLGVCALCCYYYKRRARKKEEDFQEECLRK